jgi:hypothetical protein
VKTNSHNVGEPPEKQQFKKSYVRRITEEKEANQEIEQCISYEQEEVYEESRPTRNPNGF